MWDARRSPGSSIFAFGRSRTGSRPLRIILLDGPNMPNLGNRNKRVYGPIASIEALHTYVKEVGAKLGVTIEAFASNHEGCILDEIHRTAAQCDAYIRNPAGLTKTGEATRHALEDAGMNPNPVLERNSNEIPLSGHSQRDPSIDRHRPKVGGPALRPGARCPR